MNASLKDLITISISLLSLLLSAYAVWVAQFNHGRLRMTRPTLLCLKRDFPSGIPKIFLRTCLFTTGIKGRVIENMFLRVRQARGTYTFDFWGHTENGKLSLGSGLAVGPAGVASDHHFNPREGSAEFLYVDGDYEVEVFASVIGVKQPELLQHITFSVESTQAAELIQIPTREMYLFWNADTGSYVGSVRHENRARDGSAPVGVERHEVLTTLFTDALLNSNGEEGMHAEPEETEIDPGNL
ncbi:MAG: hypothetical protein WA399_03120 [Acidobacteriaceae bacterium]